jgi:hypothetical protein
MNLFGVFFSSINEGLGWHRFESLGRRERGWNTGVDLLDHSYSLGVYSPSTLPKRQLCGGIREGNRDCDAEEIYPNTHNCVTCCSSRRSPCKLAYLPSFTT